MCACSVIVHPLVMTLNRTEAARIFGFEEWATVSETHWQMQAMLTLNVLDSSSFCSVLSHPMMVKLNEARPPMGLSLSVGLGSVLGRGLAKALSLQEQQSHAGLRPAAFDTRPIGHLDLESVGTKSGPWRLATEQFALLTLTSHL
jgi:hypothetical protein